MRFISSFSINETQYINKNVEEILILSFTLRFLFYNLTPYVLTRWIKFTSHLAITRVILELIFSAFRMNFSIHLFFPTRYFSLFTTDRYYLFSRIKKQREIATDTSCPSLNFSPEKLIAISRGTGKRTERIPFLNIFHNFSNAEFVD